MSKEKARPVRGCGRDTFHRVPNIGSENGTRWNASLPLSATGYVRTPLRKAPAFTLTELVVVLGVLSLLASAALAARWPAKNRARQAVCANNLRQLGGAVNAYLGDFHQYPTLRREWSECTLGSGRLLSYLPQGAGVFICPEKHRTANPKLSNDDFELFSYGYNAAGTAPDGTDPQLGLGLLKPIPESRVKAPAEMIGAGDSGLGELSDPWLSPTEIPGMKEAVITENPRWPSPRHGREANLVFCDNHVGSGTQKEWIQPPPESRRRWNNDHQPHRETW